MAENKKNTAPQKTNSTKKKPVSAQKQKKVDQARATQKNREILGLMFFILGLFFLFANFAFTGNIGRAVSSLSFGMTGVVGNVIPIIFALLGVYLVFAPPEKDNAFRFLLVFGIVVCICSLMHIDRATRSIAVEINYTSYVSDAYKLGSSSRYGGGALGALLTYFSMNSIGVVGSYLLYLFGGITLLILLTNISLKSAGERVGKTIKRSFDTYAEKQSVKKEERSVFKQERSEEDARIDEERRRVFDFAEIEMDEAKRNMKYQSPPKNLPPVIDKKRKSEFSQFNLNIGERTTQNENNQQAPRVKIKPEEIFKHVEMDFDEDAAKSDDKGFFGNFFGSNKSIENTDKDFFEESGVDNSSFDSADDMFYFGESEDEVSVSQDYDPHYDRFLPPKQTEKTENKNDFNYDDGLGEFYAQSPKNDELDLFAPEPKPEKIEYDNYDALAKGGNVIPFPYGYRKPRPESFANLVFDEDDVESDEKFENNDYYEFEDESNTKPIQEDIFPELKHEKPQKLQKKVGSSSGYIPPPLSLLSNPQKIGTHSDDFNQKGSILMETLESFGIKANILGYYPGPVITRFEIQLAPGVRINRLTNISNDIAMNLAVPGIRIAPIVGKAALGIEIPNKTTQQVVLRELLESKEFTGQKSNITVPLGKDIGGKTVLCNIGKMPHLLIAGSTGSGKSVCINTIICSLIYNSTPEQVKLILVDPKVVELANFRKIPHLLIPVVTNPKKASSALARAVQLMEQRYQDFAEIGARDLARYNDLMREEGFEPEPELVIIIDELADLMMVSPDEVEDAICRIAQMGRAAGIHLIVATQRPSTDIITGLIKANIPSRISFAVASGTDSRIILDTTGAEKLLGRGDMLFQPIGVSQPIRVQGAFVSDQEIESIKEYIDDSGNTYQSFDNSFVTDIDNAEANKMNATLDDDDEKLLPDIVETLMQNGSASTSMIQRRFRIGYNRAARIMDSLEDRGIITPSDGSNRARDILLSREDFEVMFGREPAIPPLGS